MTLSNYSTHNIAPYLTSKKGAELVRLFNKYGYRDLYDEKGLPDIGKANGQRPSKKEYVENRLNFLSGKAELRELLNEFLLEAENQAELAGVMTEIFMEDKYSVVNNNGVFEIFGGVIDKNIPVVNQAHFKEIEDKILFALDNAKVSIDVAMAWFTNEKLRDKLLEKLLQGVQVRIVIYDDGVNGKHGADLSQIPHKKVRGKRGGLMHDKFCVIDNQVVISGSYNWSTNAEYRNDENVTVLKDPETATAFSVEFRNLYN